MSVYFWYFCCLHLFYYLLSTLWCKQILFRLAGSQAIVITLACSRRVFRTRKRTHLHTDSLRGVSPWVNLGFFVCSCRRPIRPSKPKSLPISALNDVIHDSDVLAWNSHILVSLVTSHTSFTVVKIKIDPVQMYVICVARSLLCLYTGKC